MNNIFWRRNVGTLNWRFEADEQLRWLAEYHGLQWMQRELHHKGKIKGGLLNKTSGILAELTFRAMLDELKIPHSATEAIFDKKHDVNFGKIFDFRLADGTTIDIKALPPGSLEKLNLNQWEAQNIGVCDYYVLYKCVGMYANDEYSDMRTLDEKSAILGEKLWGQKASEEEHEKRLSEFKQVRANLEKYIKRIIKIDFVAFIESAALVKSENLKEGPYGPYYSLKIPDRLKPPFHSYQEFAADILHTTLL